MDHTVNTLRLADFEKMVNQHDLTHMYSDDGSSVRRGEESLHRIKKYARDNLSPEQAVAIWNAMVDRRVRGGFREHFYWRT